MVDKLMIHQNLSRILSDNFVTRLFITPSLLRQTRIQYSTLRSLFIKSYTTKNAVRILFFLLVTLIIVTVGLVTFDLSKVSRFWPPMTANQMIDHQMNKICRVLMLGGEECLSYLELFSIFGSKMDNMTIFNLYGLTEVSIWSSIVRILPSDADRDISSFLSNQCLIYTGVFGHNFLKKPV